MQKATPSKLVECQIFFIGLHFLESQNCCLGFLMSSLISEYASCACDGHVARCGDARASQTRDSHSILDQAAREDCCMDVQERAVSRVYTASLLPPCSLMHPLSMVRHPRPTSRWVQDEEMFKMRRKQKQAKEPRHNHLRTQFPSGGSIRRSASACTCSGTDFQ